MGYSIISYGTCDTADGISVTFVTEQPIHHTHIQAHSVYVKYSSLCISQFQAALLLVYFYQPDVSGSFPKSIIDPNLLHSLQLSSPHLIN